MDKVVSKDKKKKKKRAADELINLVRSIFAFMAQQH